MFQRSIAPHPRRNKSSVLVIDHFQTVAKIGKAHRIHLALGVLTQVGADAKARGPDAELRREPVRGRSETQIIPVAHPAGS